MAEEKIKNEETDQPSNSLLDNIEEEQRGFLSTGDINRIIEMAWEDRTPFDAITFQFGLKEDEVKSLMKKTLKFSSYKRWRTRVENCSTKHKKYSNIGIDRFKSKAQREITGNRISKKKYK